VQSNVGENKGKTMTGVCKDMGGDGGKLREIPVRIVSSPTESQLAVCQELTPRPAAS
jgi:hypothetical protein